MVILEDNVTSKGNRIPTRVEVKKIDPSRAIEHQTFDKEKRNSWCNAGGMTCSKFGKRPCCPPKTKLFSEYPSKNHLFLVMTQIKVDDYYEVYPNVKASKSWAYFGMDGTHKMTRGISNKVVATLSKEYNGLGFKVGGCSGCQWSKTGKCKYFMPMLEGVGINVCSLTLDVFKFEITWRDNNNPVIPNMTAVGAIYTDELIPQKRFKEVIRQCLRK